jgi:uncharacterized membrane protein YuzA (DUF378 family)
MKGLNKTTKVIAALGAIDLGLMAFNYEVVGSLLDVSGTFAKIIFAIVGLSGIWALVKIFK